MRADQKKTCSPPARGRGVGRGGAGGVRRYLCFRRCRQTGVGDALYSSRRLVRRGSLLRILFTQEAVFSVGPAARPPAAKATKLGAHA